MAGDRAGGWVVVEFDREGVLAAEVGELGDLEGVRCETGDGIAEVSAVKPEIGATRELLEHDPATLVALAWAEGQ